MLPPGAMDPPVVPAAELPPGATFPAVLVVPSPSVVPAAPVLPPLCPAPEELFPEHAPSARASEKPAITAT